MFATVMVFILVLVVMFGGYFAYKGSQVSVKEALRKNLFLFNSDKNNTSFVVVFSEGVISLVLIGVTYLVLLWGTTLTESTNVFILIGVIAFSLTGILVSSAVATSVLYKTLFLAKKRFN